MLSDPLAFGAVLLVTLVSIYIFIAKDWRLAVVAMAVQYVGVFILVSNSWPLELAVVKMVLLSGIRLVRYQISGRD